MCIAPANQRRTVSTDLLRAVRAPTADPPEGKAARRVVERAAAPGGGRGRAIHF